MENKDYVKNVANKASVDRPIFLADPSKLDENHRSTKDIGALYGAKIAFIKDTPKGFGSENYSAHGYKYDRAIVVLPGPNQYKRLERGLSEYRNDPSAILIMPEFGNYFDKKELTKSKDLDSILIEDKSRSAEENAIDTIYKIKRNFPGVEKITLVDDYAGKLRSIILFTKYAGINYSIDFSGIKTENKLHRITHELGALPLSVLPYRMNKKLSEKMRENNLYR